MIFGKDAISSLKGVKDRFRLLMHLMSNVEQGMSNYEVLSSFFLAVPILLTKIEINWLLSTNKSSRVRSKINL